MVGAATVFWLGYSAGRVQNIGELALRSKDADTDRFSISRAGVFVQFEQLGGDGKPFIRSSAGAELLERTPDIAPASASIGWRRPAADP